MVGNNGNSLTEIINKHLTLSNTISLSRPLIGAYAVATYGDEPWKMSVALGVAFATDALDGWVARWRNTESKVGAYLDTIADHALYLTALIGFTMQDVVHPAIPFFQLEREVLANAGRLYLENTGRQEGPFDDFSGNRLGRIAYGIAKMGAVITAPHTTSDQQHPNLQDVIFGTILCWSHIRLWKTDFRARIAFLEDYTTPEQPNEQTVS